MKDLSIGIFDSGVGGLTVLKELLKALPNERYLYLGDTARVPYGNRSPHVLRRYAFENAIFLLTKGIKLLVVACNTSSAVSLQFLRKKLPVPVFGVIEPACRKAVSLTRKGRIGVIGTKTTIESQSYVKALKRIDRAITVFSKACPLFVPIVEEGLADQDVAYLMAEKYLAEIRARDVDVLVLGCTHYPMLETVIRQAMGEGVEIVNSGLELAREVRSIIQKEGLARKAEKGSVKFFVTDDPQNFKRVGATFLGYPVGDVRLVRNLLPS